MILYGRKGKYEIKNEFISRGGEGSIHRLVNKQGYLAKIYFKSDLKKEEKIKIMLRSNLDAGALAQVSWPLDILYDEKRNFRGYVMQEVFGENLNVLYSGKYQNLNSEIRIKYAMNLCKAVKTVHQLGHVVGDFNPKNIKASTEDGLITLIDTDSFHIYDRSTNRIYRCEVGTPDYLSKEVQEKASNGMRLDTSPLPTFSVSSDLFALAIHIFSLLMNGCNPFTATRCSDNESKVTIKAQENIMKGIFPFNTKSKDFEIPSYALKYDSLPNYIRSLFNKTFIDGIEDKDFIDGRTKRSKRATIDEWINALNIYVNELEKCDRNHRYYKKLNYCPWCEMEQRLHDVMVKYNKNITMKQVSFSPNLQSDNRTVLNNNPIKTVTPINPNDNDGHSIFYWIIVLIVAIVVISIVLSLWEDIMWLFGIIIICILACAILGG